AALPRHRSVRICCGAASSRCWRWSRISSPLPPSRKYSAFSTGCTCRWYSTRDLLSAQRQPLRYAPLQVVARAGRGAFDESDMAAAALQLQRRGCRELGRFGHAVAEHEGIVLGLDQQGRDADVRQEVAA